jgi:hypothetical protein
VGLELNSSRDGQVPVILRHLSARPFPLLFAQGIVMGLRHFLACRTLRAAAGMLAVATTMIALPAFGALATYQSSVLSKNPYAYFRQQDSGIMTGKVADSIDLANRDAAYVGSPSGGATGMGSSSDTAVSYSGAATGAATQYFGGPNLQAFGASLATSSYEFIFKMNPGASTSRQTLFGAFNLASPTPNNNLGAEVTLNSLGNDAVSGSSNVTATRLFIRGTDGDGIGVHFTNATLYDGNYHHLVFTFDRSMLVATSSSALSGGFAAYVDGVPQALTFSSVNSNPSDSDFGPDGFTNFNVDPTFAARNVRGAMGTSAIQRQANVTLDEAVLYTHVLTPADVLGNYAASIAAIPETSSFALVGVVAAGIALRVNRRSAVVSPEENIC